MKFGPRLLLGTILLAALALRLAWVWDQPVDQASLEALPDQREYLELGRNLLAGRGLQFTDPRFGRQVWAFRTPGYPVFVAACGGRTLSVQIVQAFLDTATALAVYRLARRWLGEASSLIAAAIFAVNPLAIYFTSLILTETLFTAMLAWGCLLMSRRGAWLVAGAIILGVSALVRPSAIALPVCMTIAMNSQRFQDAHGSGISPSPCTQSRGPAYKGRGTEGLSRNGRSPWPRAVASAAACAGLTVLILLPWALRNQNVLGQWVWTSTNAGITRYDGFNRVAGGGSDQSFVRDMPELSQMDELQRSKYLGDLAGQYVREHPGRCVALALAKIVRFWSPVPLGGQSARPLYVAAGLVYSLPLLALAVAGMLGRSPINKAMLLTPMLYFTVIHAASVSSLRYRLPVEPLLAIAAAGAIKPKPDASPC